MQKRSKKQEKAVAKKLANVRFAEERAPDRGYAQSTAVSVPILGVHEKYQFIETYRGCYVKSYLIGDNNYLTAPEEEQMTVYKGWKSLLNSFGTEVEAALTIYNHSINLRKFCERVMYKETGDGFDDYRKELNEILMQRMKEERNGIQKDKYLTIAVHEHNAVKAARAFHRLDQDINKTLSRFGSSATPVPLEEWLDVLYGFIMIRKSIWYRKLRY